MAKKQYSLDYSIERDVDRMEAIKNILDNLETKPTAHDLELMASYVLYGKDENGKNSIDRKETTDSEKRYSSFKRISDKVQSLDELTEETEQPNFKPLTERYIYLKKKQSIARPRYAPDGTLLDVGDGDVPGMQELWADIDRVAHTVAVSEGKEPPDENTQIVTDNYRLYQLKHQLIDMRRHQYYLRDAYKPTLHFLNIQPPSPQLIDWDSDSSYWLTFDEWRAKAPNASLADYETMEENEQIYVKWTVRRHTFDWENPAHIKALIDNYSNLYMQVWDKPYSWSRTLIFDFDRYADAANLSPVRQYILLRRIDKATYATIVDEIQKKFGITYNENHICTVLTTEIPTQIARTARRQRLLLETPEEEMKRCWTCKRLMPRDILFFGRNSSRGDGFSSNCKECEKNRRIKKGGQSAHDNRNKDSNMPKM